MVNMAHDGHDRRTRLHGFGPVYIVIVENVDIGIRHACDVVAKLLDQQFCGVLVNGFVDRNRHAHFEQCFDKVAALFRHTVGKFLHRDGFRHDHIARLLNLCLTTTAAMQALFLLTRTLQRGK